MAGRSRSFRVKGRFAEGVLTITLPKAENAKPRRVQIEGNGKK